MNNRRNYYRILHVQPDAPAEVIKSSYRTLMQKLKYHPDLGGEEASAQLINEALSVLTDPDKRRRYNRENGFDDLRTKAAKPESKPEPEPVRPAGPSCPFCHTPVNGSSHYGDTSNCPTCHSPLSPVRSRQPSDACRRAMQRIKMNSPINLITEWPASSPCQGTLRNLSPTGVQFSASVRLVPGQVIRIDCAAFHATARVTHVKQQALGLSILIGAEFLTQEFTDCRGTFVRTRA